MTSTGKNPPGLAARRAAAAIAGRVMHGDDTLTEALGREARQLDALAPRDRALAINIARTTLRRRGQLEAILARLMRKSLPARARHAQAVLMSAAAQLLFMRVPAHAAIDAAVRLVKNDRGIRHLSGLVNALLRNVARRRDLLLEEAPQELNIPHWLRGNWRAAWGREQLAAMTDALMHEPRLDLTLKAPPGAEHWAAAFTSSGAAASATVLPTGSLRLEAPAPVPSLPGYGEGAWWPQDAAAAIPARLLGDVAGLNVLDLCAAPGGKTAQLAAAGAKVTALDLSRKRLERLRENLARLGLDAAIINADMLEWAPDAPFDAVLLDAPCTATGTARRHPEVLWRKTPEQMAELARLQARMLDRAASFVRPGGLLVYCVCSLQPQEGETQARAFLERHGDAFARLPVKPREVGGLAHLVNEHGDYRALPHMDLAVSKRLDGFFAARFRRSD